MADGVDIVVREFHADDIEAMIDIFRSSVRNVARRDYTEAQVIAWAPDVIDGSHWRRRCAVRQAFVAQIDNVPVGFADLESDGHLDMMYVHARCQGKGVATALLSHLETIARGLGIRDLRTEASITARPFFEHRAFHLVGQQIVATGGQEFLNYRMKKVLSESADWCGRV